MDDENFVIRRLNPHLRKMVIRGHCDICYQKLFNKMVAMKKTGVERKKTLTRMEHKTRLVIEIAQTGIGAFCCNCGTCFSIDFELNPTQKDGWCDVE